jgi:hypothetical protein
MQTIRSYEASGIIRKAKSAATCLLALLVMAEPSCPEQLEIVNPDHLEVPAARAEMVLRTACEVVAKEFHVRNAAEIEFRLVLVLGERRDGSAPEFASRDAVIDDNGISYTLYLKEWDESKFAALTMRLCIQQLANSKRQARLLKEILRRSAGVGPVSASELRKSESPGMAPERRYRGNDCLSAVRDRPCAPNQIPR